MYQRLNREGRWKFAVAAFVFVALLAMLRPAGGEAKEVAARGEGCLGCHGGIEVINERMAAAWGADVRCEVCHHGQPAAATELDAHAGLIANPGDLQVMDRTCGRCHSDHGDLYKISIQGIDDHVGRVMRSLMATAAGEIAGTRYMWNAQETRSALYGVRAVLGLGAQPPEGAVEHLRKLPPASNSDADNLLRGACLRCHLWTEDKTTPGVYRAGGCAACHVPYAENGLSASMDPAIPKDEPGHPVQHTITTLVPDSQCLSCHNDGGGRVGLSYTGLAVTHPALGPTTPGAGEKTAYGVPVMHVEPDVHFKHGIACIDCHDTVDLHGDGSIYSHMEYQVGIRCESCHGSANEPPTLKTADGRALGNIDIEEGKPYLRTKILLEQRAIPVLFTGPAAPAPADDPHAGHRRLECYACHGARVAQCYCCHMARDDRQTSPIDWVEGIGEDRVAQSVSGLWTGRSLYQRWDEATLGVNRKGRISPFMPGGQAIVTHLDRLGRAIDSNRTFTTSGGLYGFSMNPVQPHTTSTEPRACHSCHSNEKALGLGTDFADLKRLGLQLSFSPDSFVDEEGRRIQDSAHDGVRPLSVEERAAVFRTEACAACHMTIPPRARPAVGRSVSAEDADEQHRQLIEDLLEMKEK
jgi:hypothetical protein